jgi:hypothetical protein
MEIPIITCTLLDNAEMGRRAGRDVNESIRFHRIWQPVGSYAATASRLTKYGVLRRSGIL